MRCKDMSEVEVKADSKRTLNSVEIDRAARLAAIQWVRVPANSFGKVPPDMPAFQPYWENPPYGMIGRIEETSASFEARSAPRSHPTISEVECASQRQTINTCHFTR